MADTGVSPFVSTTSKLSPKSQKICPKSPLVEAMMSAMSWLWQKAETCSCSSSGESAGKDTFEDVRRLNEDSLLTLGSS